METGIIERMPPEKKGTNEKKRREQMKNLETWKKCRMAVLTCRAQDYIDALKGPASFCEAQQSLQLRHLKKYYPPCECCPFHKTKAEQEAELKKGPITLCKLRISKNGKRYWNTRLFWKWANGITPGTESREDV